MDNATIVCVLLYGPCFFLTDQVSACILGLLGGHKYIYRYRADYSTADCHLEDTDVYGQEGVYLLVLYPSYSVSHPKLPGIIKYAYEMTESSQLVYVNSVSGTRCQMR